MKTFKVLYGLILKQKTIEMKIIAFFLFKNTYQKYNDFESYF